MDSPPACLVNHLLPQLKQATTQNPHITLTWAQSLDAKIAGEGGKRVMLSGKESMLMTHWMRTMHDSILIGVNTLILDDPRLQINLLAPSNSYSPPQPIILDPNLRFPLTSRILSEYTNSLTRGDSSSSTTAKSKVVRQPWIICGDHVAEQEIGQVERAGCRVIPVKLEQGRIPPSSLPSILSSLGLKSVMIEGGSSILSSFLHAHSPSPSTSTPIVQSVVVTVAPRFIGQGVGIVPPGHDVGLPPLRTIHTEIMGKDAVMICTIDTAQPRE